MSTTERVRAGLWRAWCQLASAMTFGGSPGAKATRPPPADEPPFVDTVAGWRAV